MEAILEEEGIFGHADGSVTAPNEADANAVAAHNKNRRKCRNKLILSISEDLLDLVEDCDIW